MQDYVWWVVGSTDTISNGSSPDGKARASTELIPVRSNGDIGKIKYYVTLGTDSINGFSGDDGGFPRATGRIEGVDAYMIGGPQVVLNGTFYASLSHQLDSYYLLPPEARDEVTAYAWAAAAQNAVDLFTQTDAGITPIINQVFARPDAGVGASHSNLSWLTNMSDVGGVPTMTSLYYSEWQPSGGGSWSKSRARLTASQGVSNYAGSLVDARTDVGETPARNVEFSDGKLGYFTALYTPSET